MKAKQAVGLEMVRFASGIMAPYAVMLCVIGCLLVSCATSGASNQQERAVTQAPTNQEIVPDSSRVVRPEIQTLFLDDAIRAAFLNIEARLPEGAKVAIIKFNSPSDFFSDYVMQELTILLVNSSKKLDIVSRDEKDLKTIQDEVAYQLSGEVDDEKMIELGKQLPATYLITGALMNMDTIYKMRVKMLDPQLGKIAAYTSDNLSAQDGQVIFLFQGESFDGIDFIKQPVANETARVELNDMVRIEGGTFMMGEDNAQHQVTLSSFYMGRYEVTQKEWVAVMGSNPSSFKGDNLPVECVSWFDAVEYCNARSRQEGLTVAYTISGSVYNRTVTWDHSANGYRLPTEAEWEYACRAGTTTPYSSGSSVDGVGWYSSNSGSKTHPVGTKQAKGWGLYDMHGNVWEWCWDWYGAYGTGGQTDPMGVSSGSNRVWRGGSWGSDGQYLRSAYRYYGTPSNRYYLIGFRLLRPSV
jgi:formylglycine-generating enzyme required for sulfatase activity